MASPVSKRVDPEQPNRPYYSSLELAVLKQYTRESYEREFGMQAPPFDPNRRVKTWFDSEPLNGYKTVYAEGGQARMKSFFIDAEEARLINLPGPYRYQPWNPMGTSAVRVWGGGTAKVAIPPKQIVEKEEALLVARLLGDSTPQVEEVLSTGFLGFEWGNKADGSPETRRYWNIVLDDGKRLDAGGLVAKMYAKGVGAPGHFARQGNGDFSWVDAQVVSEPNRPELMLEWDVPMRDLKSNEVLATGSPFLQAGGRYPALMRTDLVQPVGGGGSGAGSYTDSDRQRDVEIHAMLGLLLQKLLG